jgi:hypothetical protein
VTSSRQPQLLPALDVLFCSLRDPVPHADLAAKSIELGPDDWHSLADLAIDLHRVGPKVWSSLETAAHDTVPPDVAARFKVEAREAKIRTLTSKAETARVLRAFNGAGIEPCLLKGWALEEALFGDIGQRVTYDVDVMVKEHELPAASKLLQDLGYSCTLPEDYITKQALNSFIRFAHHVVFFRPASQTVIELHVRPFRNRHVLPLADFETESCSLSVRDETAAYRVPSPPCNFVYLALHGYMHRWERAKWLIDIPPLMRNLASSDWQWIQRQAKDLAVEKTIGIALALSQDLLKADIPGPARALLDKANGSYLASACRRELLAEEPYSDGPKLGRWLEGHVISLCVSSRLAVLGAAIQILIVRESDVLTSELADRFRLLQYLFAALCIPKRVGQRLLRRFL